jgi:hypothetical protein
MLATGGGTRDLPILKLPVQAVAFIAHQLGTRRFAGGHILQSLFPGNAPDIIASPNPTTNVLSRKQITQCTQILYQRTISFCNCQVTSFNLNFV